MTDLIPPTREQRPEALTPEQEARKERALRESAAVVALIFPLMQKRGAA